MRHTSRKTDELQLSGGLTDHEWWEVGYADGLLDQPASTAYRPPTQEMEGWYARGRSSGIAERKRRLVMAARASWAMARESPARPAGAP
jgi:hypothetical protein